MTKRQAGQQQGSKWRHHWGLAPGTTFLNHGSFGACPRAILNLQSELRALMEGEPVQFLWRRYEERLEPSRTVLAKFLRARRKDLVFVTNATTGVNAVMQSVDLRAGEEVLTTSLDYNACRNVLSEAVRRAGAKLVTVDIPFPTTREDEVIDRVLSGVTKRTRLAMLDHVTSSTALVLPVQGLIRELEARSVETLIDGAHGPGMVPVDLARLRPAYYTANLHKWVCAPKGAAFLWVREDLQAEMQPAVISHGHNTPRPGYSGFQDRFDWAGTFDPTAWFCVGPAIEWMAALMPEGWTGIREANHKLAIEGRRLLLKALDVAPMCPESMLGAMATLPLPARFQGRRKLGKIDREQLRLYDRFGIEVPLFRIGQPERRYLRISAQLYNTLEDYARLAEALKEL